MSGILEGTLTHLKHGGVVSNFLYIKLGLKVYYHTKSTGLKWFSRK
jgi:hypothetical protein